MSKKITKDIASEEEKIEEKAVKKVAKTTKKSAATKTAKKATPTKTVAKADDKKVKKSAEKDVEKDDKKKEKVVKTTKKIATKKDETVDKKAKSLEKEKVKATSLSEEANVEKPKKRGRPRKVVNTEEIKEESKDLEEKPKATKKAATKKATTKKTTKKANKDEKETKKSSTKKATTASTRKKSATTKKKTATKKSSKSSKLSNNKRTIRFVKTLSLSKQYLKKNTAILEYFDLPYRYNETTVKVLAQTPKVLFVYWDISDYDRDQYKLNYGEDFFDTTYPVLLLKNESKGYVEEIPINDFANSWYIHISDPRSKYSIELGRKYKNMPKFESPYIYIKESNEIIAPNDHVLLEEIKPKIKYKNAKTNEVIFKNISNVIKDGKILDFYSLYQVMYNVEDINNFFSLDNPSSGNPTSTFK